MIEKFEDTDFLLYLMHCNISDPKISFSIHGKTMRHVESAMKLHINSNSDRKLLRVISPLIDNLTSASINCKNGVLWDGTEFFRIKMTTIRKRSSMKKTTNDE